MKEIELQILEYNYWEHFKHAKDLAMVLPVGHPKRLEVEKHLNELQEKISKMKKADD